MELLNFKLLVTFRDFNHPHWIHMDEEYIKMNVGSNLKSQARLARGRWRIEYSVWGRKFPYLSFIMIHSYLAGQKYENVGEMFGESGEGKLDEYCKT